ncbi:MAG: AAA family ATPase [Magnetococcales bacterium]|nr:AAA family ATPase [Magnetococcales bacterium]
MHRFIDFKGFADAQLDLSNPVTLLIGKNGSGKSNVIEGVELFANLAHGLPLHDITDLGRGGPQTFQIRGGLPGCPRLEKKAFELQYSSWTYFDGDAEGIIYSIKFQRNNNPKISEEILKIGSRTLFSAQSKKGQPDVLSVQYDNFARGGNKPSALLPADRAILSRYSELTAHLDQRSERHQDARRAVIDIQKYLRASFVFDPNPRAMREYERQGQKILARDGSNLSSVLYSLSQGNGNEKKTISRILDQIQQLPEEPFEEIRFVTTAQHDVLFGLGDKGEGPFMDARVLSDGTLRCLAVLTALETVKESSRIVVEEFDNGLHPSRVGVLTDAIWETCKRRNLNILVTTHNPATLDALNDEQLKGVVLCYHDQKQKASKLLPLHKLPLSDVWLEEGQLGNLVTQRLIEKYLDPDYEEKRQKIATEWLADLA